MRQKKKMCSSAMERQDEVIERQKAEIARLETALASQAAYGCQLTRDIGLLQAGLLDSIQIMRRLVR